MSQIPPPLTSAIRDYINIAFRRKWFFIVPFILFFTFTLTYAYLKPAIYRSKALIVVEEEVVRNPFVAGLAVPTSLQRKLHTLMQKTLSNHHLKKVVEELSLEEKLTKINNTEEVINMIRANVHSSLKGDKLIELSFDGPDPVLCRDILKALVDVFITESLKVEDIQTIRGIDFLKSQLEHYRKKLEDSEKALADYKKSHMKDLSIEATQQLETLIGFPKGVNVNVSRLMGFEMELINLRLELDQLKKEAEKIRNQLSKEDKVIVSQTVKTTDPVTQELNNQLISLQIKMNSLLVDSSPDHPEVLRLKKKISNIEQLLKERSAKRVEEETYSLNPVRIELQQRLNKIETRIDSLKKREELLVVLTRKYQEKVDRLPDQEREYARLMRDYNVNSGMYQALLNKLQTAEMTQRLEDKDEAAKFTLLDPPTLSYKPIKPKRKRIIFLGLVAGFMLGCGTVIGVESMDKSFKNEKGLSALVGVPVLASIPRILLEQEERIRKARQKLTLILLGSFILFMVIMVAIKYILKGGIKV